MVKKELTIVGRMASLPGFAPDTSCVVAHLCLAGKTLRILAQNLRTVK